MAPQLAFIGLGGMGQAMTANLVAKANLSNPLILFNRNKQRAEEHSSSIGHSTVAPNLEEAVLRSDIIWTCLQDQEAVSEVFGKILKLDISGKLFVECSTILPDATRQLDDQVRGGGADLVAMPVFGEPSLARKGALICVPAGPERSVERIRPFLTGVIGRAVVDLGGEEPAKSSLLKCIGNILLMTTIEQLAEVHVFAEKSGLGSKHMTSLVETMFPRPPHTVYSSKMTTGEYFKGETIVELYKARALTSHILELASASNASLKSYEVAVGHLAAAEAHAGSQSDIVGIYGAVRVESGLPFQNGDSPDDLTSSDEQSRSLP